LNEDDEDEHEDFEGQIEADDREDDNDEVTQAFELFTQFQPKYNTLNPRERRITIQDLRRVARELKEEVDEKVLRLMVEEANGEVGDGSVKRGVGVREFEDVMRRAGAVGRG